MTPDPRLDALGLVPRRVPTDALLAEAAREHAAAEERARRLCLAPAPGFDRDPPAAAFVLFAWVASFGAGAIVQAHGGWPASLAIGSACAGASVWAVLRGWRA